MTEEKIISGCIAGRRKYQNMLFRHYAPVMLAICMRYSHDRDSAEDIMQEGFIKVFNHIGNFRGEGSFEGWIKRIMVNTAINHFKQMQRQRAREELSAFDSNEAVADNLNHEEEQLPDHYQTISSEDVMKLVQELPSGYRMVMNLYVFEGHTHKEIADLMGISENTSKSQLSKARQYLKKKITEMNKQYQLSNV